MGVGLELLLYDLPEDLTQLLCFMIKARRYLCHLVVNMQNLKFLYPFSMLASHLI